MALENVRRFRSHKNICIHYKRSSCLIRKYFRSAHQYVCNEWLNCCLGPFYIYWISFLANIFVRFNVICVVLLSQSYIAMRQIRWTSAAYMFITFTVKICHLNFFCTIEFSNFCIHKHIFLIFLKECFEFCALRIWFDSCRQFAYIFNKLEQKLHRQLWTILGMKEAGCSNEDLGNS